MKYVYVVTSRDLGWDNVVGVFDASTITLEELQAVFREPPYYIDHRRVEVDFENYE
jgi:hypothetical protein